MAEVEIAAGRLRGRARRRGGGIRRDPVRDRASFRATRPGAGLDRRSGGGRPGPAAPSRTAAAATFTHGELPATDEQCLNLNVFTPGLDDRRPVFVWLHGGGFAIGHAGASLYSGERLARQPTRWS